MVIALRKACARQKKRQPFGPIDISSLYPLIERGLIDLTFYHAMGERKSTWYVTKKGLRMLYSVSRIKSCI
jgi:hypothetical protein